MSADLVREGGEEVKIPAEPYGEQKPIRVRLVGIRTGSAWPALVAQAVQSVQSVQIPSPPRQVAHWAHDQEHRESPN